MLSRKIGKLIRGKVTPAQIAMACVLGAMLGFVPSLRTSPGLVLALTALVLVLNANLFIAAVIAGGAKLLSLLIMPVQFEVGRLVLDGPLSGLMGALINAPVLAWFGFEYYTTTGGIVLGLLVGVLCAAALVAALTQLRRRLSKLETGSERFQKITAKKWVRALLWILVGKRKKSYEELLAKRVGLPIRPLGVVAAVLMVGLVWIGALFLSEPLITSGLQRGLEQANGATVDIGSATVDLSEGRMVVTGLAMADPENLSTDIFRAATVEAKISTSDLLRKRMAIDTLVAADASTGKQRRTPGQLIGPKKKPPAPKPAEEGKPIDEYLKEAEKWKDRLEQARKWLEELSRKKDEAEPEAGPGAPPAERRETLRERLAREIAEKGYARVAAAHLIEGAPTLLVRDTRVEGMTAEQAPGEVFDVRAQNVSTQPWLVEQPPRVSVASRSGAYEAEVVLGSAMSAQQSSTLKLARRGIPGDDVGRAIASGSGSGAAPLAGGTVDALIEGAFRPEWIDLPLNVTVRNSTITIPGAGSAQVEQLALPIGVVGPMNAPSIDIDSEAWSKALAQAGASQLANQLKGEAQKEIDKATEKVTDEIGDKARDALGGLLGGKKKDDGGG
ncbi:MAG: hypothetical protein ACF8R7_10610 [Phycisphaerales bacterium JB039]